MASPLEIFCCYARKDKVLLDELKTHLIPLQREGLISIWNDSDISPGTDWEEEINKHLDTAQLILLLVSPSFMASEYCYSKEMKRAVERHNQGKARVIPVILRSVHWQRAPFGKLQALPKDAKPVKSWRDQDKAFVDVVTGIIIAIEQLTTRSPETTEVILVKPNETLEISSIKTTDSVLTSAQPRLSAISITPSSSPTVSESKNIFPSLEGGEQAHNSLPDWDDLPPLNEQLPAAIPDWDDLPLFEEAESSLTVQQVKDAWDRVKKRTKQKNRLVAAVLTHCKIVAIEGTDEEPVVVLQFPSEAHYKIANDRSQDVEWALTTEFGRECRVRLLHFLTVEQVREVWEQVRKQTRQKNGLAAATLAHSNIVAVEGTSEEAVVVLSMRSEAHYKIINDRLKDVEWALTTVIGKKCAVRLLPFESPLDHSL